MVENVKHRIQNTIDNIVQDKSLNIRNELLKVKDELNTMYEFYSIDSPEEVNTYSIKETEQRGTIEYISDRWKTKERVKFLINIIQEQ